MGPVSEHCKWSLFQKNKLLRLLKEYPIDAYESIAEHFSNRDAQQIEHFITKLKQEIRTRNRYISRDDIQRVPLEQWLNVATDLVDFENVDCSANLIKVLSIISKFEDFPCEYEGPDYCSIYKFMSQILQPTPRDDLIQLEPLESAIMLDMIHSLMDVLSQQDTSVQRNVMKWKYILMNYRNRKQIVPDILRKASENDFKEFIEEMRDDKNYNKRETFISARRADSTPENSMQTKSNKTTTPKQSSTASSTQRNSENVPEQSTSGTVPKQSTYSTVPRPSTSGTMSVKSMPTSTSTSKNTERLIDQIPDRRPEIKHHKPGRKGALDQPETPRTEIVLVMPPKGVKIVNYEVRGKKCQNQRIDGKYRPLSRDEQLISDDLNREVTYDVHRSEVEKGVKMSSAANVRLNEDTAEAVRKRQRSEEANAKYDELLASQNDETRKRPLKKQKLYSINPFCLPVSLIDLNSS